MNWSLAAFRFSVNVLLAISITNCAPTHNSNNINVFKYNESSGIVSLDPAFAKDLPHIWVCNQLFNRLVSLDDQMNVVPSIAKNWEITNNGLTYTFLLRNDVFFHDHETFKGKNRTVTASDFVFSFNRIMDQKLASPGAWIFKNIETENGKPAVKAINDTLLQIKLQKPFPAFLGLLSMTYASVVAHEIIALYGNNIRSNPIGTGPFKHQYWKEGVKLVLKRNENYFEKENGTTLPYLNYVSISFLIDKQTAFMEFVKGNLDFMSGIDARFKDELLTRSGFLKANYTNKIKLIRQPYLNTEYIGFYLGENTSKPNVLRQKLFRQAINYAIDREKMLKYLRNSVGRPGHGGMIPYGMPGHNSNGSVGYKYDISKARKIIKDNGFENEKITITTTADYVDVFKFVQSQLNAIGLDASIEVMQSATLREMRAKGQLACFRASWVADYPDAENYLSLFYSPNKAPAGPNYTHYDNKTFDGLFEKTMADTSASSRSRYYQTLDSLMMTEAPVVVLYYDEVLRFVNKRVSDLGSNPTNLLDLRRTKVMPLE